MPRRTRITSLEGLLAAAQALHRKQTLVVAAAEDDAALKGAGDAARQNLIHPVLIGDKLKITRLARSLRVSLKDAQVVHEPDPAAACLAAVRMCRAGEAQILMKGMVQTSVVLKAILDKENGLATGGILSHAAVFAPKGWHRLMILTDAGVNINPDVARKAEIIKNACALAHCLGISRPKTAMLAAVETVKPQMPATTDAAMLVQMSLHGQLDDAVVAGPYALDLAISRHAAEAKGVRGPVAGKADILVAPGIETANVLYKALGHFAGLDLASLVLGASVPLVIASRADSSPTKLFSIALAAVLAHNDRPQPVLAPSALFSEARK